MNGKMPYWANASRIWVGEIRFNSLIQFRIRSQNCGLEKNSQDPHHPNHHVSR